MIIMRTVRKRSALAYVIGALIDLSVPSEIPESKTSSHFVLYRLWRVMFFPIAMLCLFIVGGARGRGYMGLLRAHRICAAVRAVWPHWPAMSLT